MTLGAKARELWANPVFLRVGRRLPDPVKKRLSDSKKQLLRSLDPVDWGDLRRLEPRSGNSGLDRGTPVDRVYIERFLERNASAVRGRVLEVLDDGYARRFGSGVARRDVMDIDPGNRHATIVADLAQPGSLPPETFDCFILTETLQLVSDPVQALANGWGALRPGGTLLVTVPTVNRADPPHAGLDRWRFTPAGLTEIIRRACPGAEVEVDGSGNLLAAVAFLSGIAAEELEPHEVDHRDPAYVVNVSARIVKPAALSLPPAPQTA